MAGPSKVITAVEMAEASEIDPKRLRAALRAAHLQWHPHNGRWEAVRVRWSRLLGQFGG